MKKKNIFPVFLVLSGIVLGGSGLAHADAGVRTTRGNVDRTQGEIRENRADRESSSYVEGEIVVKLKGDSRFRRIRLARGSSVEAAIERYRGRADVEYAEPNYIATTYSVPNDPYYGLQWHFDNPVSGGIDTEQAWDISTGSGVVVAVIDTGVAYENRGSRRNAYYQAPDLADTCFVQGYDFVNNDTHPNDDNSHGTHVTGTIAGSTNNGIGVAGVAFDACIMPIKVLGGTGSGSYADIADGIRYAADNGADIINLSLGGPSSTTYLEDAVEYAYNAGVTIFAAAGNDDSSNMGYPASYNPYVVAVGATRFDEQLAYYSNYGTGLDIVAPGGDVTVNQNGDAYVDGVLQNTFNPNTRNRSDFGYWFFQGTSMATPHAAGVAALLIENGNATTPDQVRAALQDTAKDLGSTGWDSTFGHGLINAKDALGWTAGPVVPGDDPPTASVTGPSEGVVVSGAAVSITANATDDNAVDRVDFYVDEAMVGSDSTNAYGISWDSTTVADGDYVLKVTAVDSASQTTSDTVNVTVDNINDPPAADAGANQAVFVNAQVNFDGSDSSDPDGSIVSYSWDFDASNGIQQDATGETPSHTYTAIGAYTVTLTVTDNDGSTDQDTMTVDVSVVPVNNTLFEDSFESGLGNWTQDAQNDWRQRDQRATDGTYSAEVDGRATNASLTSDPIDLQGYSNVTVSADMYIERKLDRDEYIALETSTDGGATWDERARLDGNVSQEDTWHAISFDLTNITSLQIRLVGTMSRSNEDANVDMVSVEGF